LADVDRQFLSGLKRSFSNTESTLAWSDLWPVLLLAALLLLIVFLFWLAFRPKPSSLGGVEPEETVEEPEQVEEIIRRSVDLRAVYDVEIQDPAYKETYRGPILGVGPGGAIEMEMGKYTDLNLDFVNRPARVAFRMSRRGRQFFFQFETQTLGVGLASLGRRKERGLRLRMPQRLVVGQKRRHLRVEPTGSLRFKVHLMAPESTVEPIPLNHFRKIHETEVMDLSTGGMQVKITARSGEIKVRPGRPVHVYFKLPVADLDEPGLVSEQFLLAEVVSVDRRDPGRRVFSRAMDDRTPAPHLIRLRFTGVGEIKRPEKVVFFRRATPVSFNAISRWLQAYQRRLIQLEKGTFRRPDRPQNIYPRKEWNIECKYPGRPPGREGK
jgi:hypothetical protein